MVRIEKYLGEFGNCMFQYAYAHVMCIRTNQAYTGPIPDEVFKKNIVRETMRLTDNKPMFTTITVRDDNAVSVFNDSCTRVGLQLWGFFQKIKFYRNYKVIIKRLYMLPKMNLERRSVVLHVRRGDYRNCREPSVLDMSYYANILESIKYDKLYVIGRGIDDVAKTALERFHPIYTGRDYIYDYRMLLSAKRIIMSNSTFAWWGAWLSDAEKIWFPVPSRGIFSRGYANQRLYVEDEPRYEYVEGIATT